MSFSSGVKDELSRHQTLARHCQIAEIAAIISMCGGVSISALNSLAAFRIRIASSWFNTATVYVRLPFENVPCLIETSTSILNAFFNNVKYFLATYTFSVWIFKL